MTTSPDCEQDSIIFPAGFDGRGIVESLNHPAWRRNDHNGRAYRVAVTRGSPVRFALTYLSHYLAQQDTGQLSFSRMHLDLAHEAISWMPDRRGCRVPRRDIWVAPRGAAKTIWQYVILPAWALAHRHREYFMAFSASAGQAIGHLSKLRLELNPKSEYGNHLLLYDFPHLLPAKGAGSRNTHQTVTAGGVTLAAHGMGEKTLGMSSGTRRADLICGDDLEPGGADYSPAAKDKQLRRLVDNVLPMGTKSTVTQLNGTVTMYDSIIHDAVRHALGEKTATWIAEENFRCHYYEPIITDPDGTRRSMWPQRWTLDELEGKEGTRSYALNFLNNPTREDSWSVYWTEDGYQYHPSWRVASRALFIDGAVTSKPTSDHTAMVVIGRDAALRHAVVEHAWSGQITGGQIKQRIWEWCAGRSQADMISAVYVESNQGGDLWASTLRPLPPGVELILYPASGSKTARIKTAHAHYERGAVWHVHPLPSLQAQQCAWPRVDNDDLCDAVAAGLRWALGDPL
jgi:hypothetical protein